MKAAWNLYLQAGQYVGCAVIAVVVACIIITLLIIGWRRFLEAAGKAYYAKQWRDRDRSTDT